MGKVNINTGKFNGQIRQAFRATVLAVDTQCRVEISAEKWKWPGKTKRKNGMTVGSPRDIVDTGQLQRSQRLSFFDGDTFAILEWGVEYALINHEGRSSDGELQTARPWTRTAIATIKPVERFGKELKRLL